MTPPWRHSLTFVHMRGKVKAICVCGGQSSWFTDYDELRVWEKIHTGIVERKVRR